MPNTHSHIEDYIEIVAGYRNSDGKNIHSIFTTSESPISLARYDVKIVDSLAQQGFNNTAYTDKQAALAISLVLKYERQLSKLGVDIGPVKTQPQFRIPLRVIDRSSRAWVENDIIKIKFPYMPDVIEKVREQNKTSCGRIQFNREDRVWEAALTEYNVNWAYTFCQAHKFDIDPALEKLMNLVLEAEKTPYKIELTTDGVNELVINNASDALREYIKINLGGFGTDNLLRLVDSAPILGYTVSQMIEEVVIEAYGTRFFSLCNNLDVKVDLDSRFSDIVAEIVRYAAETNRFPIYVYEPDLSNKLTMLFMRHFTKEQIVKFDTRETITDQTRLVYAEKIPKFEISRIPLMVSSAGMLYGGDRQLWLQAAEKVVYFTKDVYNKNTKQGHKVCKLD